MTELRSYASDDVPLLGNAAELLGVLATPLVGR